MYNTNYKCTYHTIADDIDDHIYKKDMLGVFGVERFDSCIINSHIESLYENLKNNDDLVSCMKKAATTLLSEDPVLGLMILFSYDFLFVSHPCICAYLENLEDTFKEKLLALQERIKTFVSKE